METHSPGEMLRRFVLDFLVEEALRDDPSVDGDRRKALGASFSVEPVADLGYARKYRVISTSTQSNRRVYVFLLNRAINDRAFSSTELLFKRCLKVLRDGKPGSIRAEHDLLIREAFRKQRLWEEMGFILSEVVEASPKVPSVPLGRFSEVPRSLVDLGVIEVYPKGTLSENEAQGGDGGVAAQLAKNGQAEMKPLPPEGASPEGASPPAPSFQGEPGSSGAVTVHDWLKRAYEDTFGSPPIHVTTSSPKEPVITLRVRELSEEHESWAVEVTRHLRIREGSLDLSVQLLEVK